MSEAWFWGVCDWAGFPYPQPFSEKHNTLSIFQVCISIIINADDIQGIGKEIIIFASILQTGNNEEARKKAR